MKFAVALIAILATANAWTVPNLGKGDLYKDLQEFVDLIPIEKIQKLLLQYAAEDAEIQRGLTYVKSDEFKSLVKQVDAMPDYINLLNYIYGAGVDIYYLVNLLHDYMEIPKLIPPQGFSEYGITGGYKGLIEDAKKFMPKDKIKALYYQKLQTSPSFKELIDHFKSPEFQKLVHTIYTNPQLQYIVKRAKESGLDLESVRKFFHVILGIDFPLFYY